MLLREGRANMAKRDRNLVNRELSDLAGMSPRSHAKPAPHLLTRVGRGQYIFREPELPKDRALLREYLEPHEVYEKRPLRRRRSGPGTEKGTESLRMSLFAVQRGICPGCGFSLPHFLRCDVDYTVALADDGRTEVKNPKLLCDFCRSVKDAKEKDGYRLKMAQLRSDNVATGVMVDEGLAVLPGKRLARYHVGEIPTRGGSADAFGVFKCYRLGFQWPTQEDRAAGTAWGGHDLKTGSRYRKWVYWGTFGALRAILSPSFPLGWHWVGALERRTSPWRWPWRCL